MTERTTPERHKHIGDTESHHKKADSARQSDQSKGNLPDPAHRDKQPPGATGNPMPGIDPEQTPGVDHAPAEQKDTP